MSILSQRTQRKILTTIVGILLGHKGDKSHGFITVRFSSFENPLGPNTPTYTVRPKNLCDLCVKKTSKY